jgi:outer membrane protein, heavy metal efflux system
MLRFIANVGPLLTVLLCRHASAEPLREIVARAVAAHPLVVAEKERLAAVRATRSTAAVLLPSPPEIAFSMAERRLWQPTAGGPTPVLNFYLTLSQRIELGGQRGARIETAEAKTRAQLQRVALIELSVAARAAEAALAAAALRERAVFVETLRRAGERLSAGADARLAEALISQVDAALLAAEAAHLAFDADELTIAKASADARLRSLVGELPQEIALPATPPPLGPGAWIEHALSVRADLAALQAERDAALAIKKQEQRERVPTITLSGFLQSDGFDERVLGAGISVPLFLPSPLAPSRRGEIDSAAASVRALEAEIGARQRDVRQEVEEATAVLRAREHQASLYPQATLDRTRAHVEALLDALLAGKIAVREGLTSLRILIELVNRGTSSRLALYSARLGLARAAALPIEEVLP